MRKVLRFLSNKKRQLGLLVFMGVEASDRQWVFAWKKVDTAKGWLSKAEAHLLYILASGISHETIIVEIGSYEGRSTLALASGAQKDVEIYAIDPHTGDRTEVEAGKEVDTWGNFLRNTEKFPNVHPIRKISAEATSLISGKKIRLLFVDGWHSEDAVNSDIQNYLTFAAREFTIVFDDWNHPEVSAGIKKNLKNLPPLVGSIGKDLVFSNASFLTRSVLRNKIRLASPRRVIKNYSLGD